MLVSKSNDSYVRVDCLLALKFNFQREQSIMVSLHNQNYQFYRNRVWENYCNNKRLFLVAVVGMSWGDKKIEIFARYSENTHT